MNQHGPDSDRSISQTMRTVVVKGICLSTDHRVAVLRTLRQANCQCLECSGLRAKLGPPGVHRQDQLSLPECTVLVSTLISLGCREEAGFDEASGFDFRDRALDSAGTICWQMGDAFHFQCRDFPAHLLHTVSQNHSHLRDVIEAKRLLLWFHHNLDQMTPIRMRVTHFEFDAELCGLAGVVFNESTQRAVYQAAENAVAGWRKQGLF
jgi:hypothetical protein